MVSQGSFIMKAAYFILPMSTSVYFPSHILFFQWEIIACTLQTQSMFHPLKYGKGYSTTMSTELNINRTHNKWQGQIGKPKTYPLLFLFDSLSLPLCITPSPPPSGWFRVKPATILQESLLIKPLNTGCRTHLPAWSHLGSTEQRQFMGSCAEIIGHDLV